MLVKQLPVVITKGVLIILAKEDLGLSLANW